MFSSISTDDDFSGNPLPPSLSFAKNVMPYLQDLMNFFPRTFADDESDSDDGLRIGQKPNGMILLYIKCDFGLHMP